MTETLMSPRILETDACWRAIETRDRSADGRFVFADLPPGEYLIAALTDLDPIDLQDPAFLEQIASAGAKVTIAEGEKKVQDLKMGGAG